MLEQNVLNNKNRLEGSYLAMLKGYLITEFRSAELGEDQMSEEQYSNLFDKCMQEIFNDAGHHNSGEDIAEHNQNLHINKNAAKHEKVGGMTRTDSGLWIPS